MNLTFKKLKRGLKIMREGYEPVKISLHLWEGIQRAELNKNVNRYAVRYLSYKQDQALQDRGLTEDVSYPGRDYRGRKITHRAYDCLTDFGHAVREQMPECPPRSEWPEAPKSALSSPTNVKLTDHQQAVINNWTKRLSKALPVGSSELESSRWQIPERGGKSTTAALLRQGMIEPGIMGLKIVDGNVELEDRVGEIHIVYRLTVLGAMHSDKL